MLARVPSVSDSNANRVALYSFARWNDGDYDSIPIPYNDAVYCSELIWDSYYNSANVELNDNSIYPLGIITPDDLLMSSFVQSVMAYTPIID